MQEAMIGRVFVHDFYLFYWFMWLMVLLEHKSICRIGRFMRGWGNIGQEYLLVMPVILRCCRPLQL